MVGGKVPIWTRYGAPMEPLWSPYEAYGAPVTPFYAPLWPPMAPLCVAGCGLLNGGRFGHRTVL